jgi:hypothetical protein
MLIDKKTNQPFYVGSTTNLRGRLSSHKSDAHPERVYTCLHHYILQNKIEFDIAELEEIIYDEKKELLSSEKFWIEQLRQWGFALQNNLHNPSLKSDYVRKQTMKLDYVPKEVNDIVRREQLRIELHEREKLKKHEVYYRIIREWNQLAARTKMS